MASLHGLKPRGHAEAPSYVNLSNSGRTNRQRDPPPGTGTHGDRVTPETNGTVKFLTRGNGAVVIALGYQDAIELLWKLHREAVSYSVESAILMHARWYLQRRLGEYLCGHVVRIDG